MVDDPKTKMVFLPSPEEVDAKPMNIMSGSKVDDFTNNLCSQVFNSMWFGEGAQTDPQIQAGLAVLMGVKPQDELEGMLAAQMIAAHNAAMECFRRAMTPNQSTESRHLNLNQANKLTRSYTTQMEALGRYRGKGQQKMTVEHVHVHAGGQAIVGNVTRPEGGGVSTKSEEQPHATAITHAPLPEMPRPHPKRQSVPIPRDA